MIPVIDRYYGIRAFRSHKTFYSCNRHVVINIAIWQSAECKSFLFRVHTWPARDRRERRACIRILYKYNHLHRERTQVRRGGRSPVSLHCRARIATEREPPIVNALAWESNGRDNDKSDFVCIKRRYNPDGCCRSIPRTCEIAQEEKLIGETKVNLNRSSKKIHWYFGLGEGLGLFKKIYT